MAWFIWFIGLVFVATFGRSAAEVPFYTSELLFPSEPWHNHASCVVESGHGDLLVCWFHGSGERKADDVRVEGTRWEHRHQKWSDRFILADTPGYPDCNPCFLIDRRNRLWLFHTTILAHTWESALLKYHRTDQWERPGTPVWNHEGVVPITPGQEFTRAVSNALPRFLAAAATNQWDVKTRREVDDYLTAMGQHMTNELYLRLGWMPRAHPSVLGKRLLLPLYHDGFSFSLIAISDDDGETWRCHRSIQSVPPRVESKCTTFDGWFLAEKEAGEQGMLGKNSPGIAGALSEHQAVVDVPSYCPFGSAGLMAVIFVIDQAAALCARAARSRR